jgi:pyruvate carboxylase subunit B
VQGRTIVVTLAEGRVEVEGQGVDAEVLEVRDSPIRLLRLGDQVYELVARRGDRRGTYSLTVDGVEMAAEALDERAEAVRTLKAATAGSGGPEPLKAPMPGLITRVLIRPGDTVQGGDGLVVMEAMKMENELRARGTGTVRAVHASPGTAVEKGATLVEFV